MRALTCGSNFSVSKGKMTSKNQKYDTPSWMSKIPKLKKSLMATLIGTLTIGESYEKHADDVAD